jgi:hypothetical protein
MGKKCGRNAGEIRNIGQSEGKYFKLPEKQVQS